MSVKLERIKKTTIDDSKNDLQRIDKKDNKIIIFINEDLKWKGSID